MAVPAGGVPAQHTCVCGVCTRSDLLPHERLLACVDGRTHSPDRYLQVGTQRLADLMVLEFANTLNEALCERHRRYCADADGALAPALAAECRTTFAIAEEIRAALLELGAVPQGSEASLCRDLEERCPDWALAGDCDANAGAAAHRL